MIYIKAVHNEETILKIIAVSCEIFAHLDVPNLIIIRYKYYERATKSVQESSCQVNLQTDKLYITTYHKY